MWMILGAEHPYYMEPGWDEMMVDEIKWDGRWWDEIYYELILWINWFRWHGRYGGWEGNIPSTHSPEVVVYDEEVKWGTVQVIKNENNDKIDD